MENLLVSVDMVCERTHPGFWAEPLNLLTSLAYCLVAVVVRLRAPDWLKRDRAFTSLLIMVFIVGLASFCDHSLSIRIAHLFNEAATTLFLLAYVIYASRRLLGWDRLWTSVIVLSITICGMLLTRWPRGAELSEIGGYFPLWIFILYLAWSYRRKRAAKLFMAGAGTFVISVGFRTTDVIVCPHFAPGTHFLWHLCNDVVLFCLLMGLVRATDDSLSFHDSERADPSHCKGPE